MTASATLRTWREALGLTPEQAAEIVGMTGNRRTRNWERWEHPDSPLDEIKPLEQLTEYTDDALEALEQIRADLAAGQLTRYINDAALDTARDVNVTAKTWNQLVAHVALRELTTGRPMPNVHWG